MLQHQVRSTAQVRKALGRLVDELPEYFTSNTACLTCKAPIGTEPASCVVALTESLAMVQLTHGRCGSPLAKELSILPVSQTSGYEYKTLLLPVGGDTGTTLVPTLLVRLGIDALFLRMRQDGRGWERTTSSDLSDGGFRPLDGEMAVADDTSWLELGTHTRVHLPDGQELDVHDPMLHERVQESGFMLVVSLSGGSVDTIDDANKLARCLTSEGTIGAIVDVRTPEAGDEPHP